MKTYQLGLGLLFAATLAPAVAAQCNGCSAAAEDRACATPAAKSDIVDTATGAGQFQTLAAALHAADLVGALQGDGPFTVFAPTDDAFAALPEGTVATLLKPENRAKLVAVLTYHVVPGRIAAKDVLKSGGLTTLNGQRIEFSVRDGQAFADGARIVKTDIECSNGVIHVLDAVVLPSSQNLVEVAQASATFKTLIAAASAAGLAETLSTGGPLTVFAPTDDAFAALPAGTVESLLKPENREQLANILKLHVVSGRVYSTDALRAGHARSLSGGSLEIVASADGKVRVNGAGLVTTDIDAANGVIHVIDGVILPN